MNKKPLILGIESSCDETAASLVTENEQGSPVVLSNIIFTSFFIFIVGFLDDKFKMNPGSRILFQFLIIFFL